MKTGKRAVGGSKESWKQISLPFTCAPAPNTLLARLTLNLLLVSMILHPLLPE